MTVKEALFTPAVPAEGAANLKPLPDSSIRRSEYVATPFRALTTVVPVRIAPLALVPAAVELRWTLMTRTLAGPAVMLNVALVTPVSPVALGRHGLRARQRGAGSAGAVRDGDRDGPGGAVGDVPERITRADGDGGREPGTGDACLVGR